MVLKNYLILLIKKKFLDKKKREREKLGSVNLRADEETNKYEIEIKKMEQDRARSCLSYYKIKRKY